MKPLFKHQLETLEKGLQLDEYLADFSDAGTGKTRSALEIYIHKQSPGDRLLIVTTKASMEATWGQAIREFYPHLKYTIATGPTKREALSNPPPGTDVVITNHDSAGLIANLYKKKQLPPYPYLIVDESTAFKNPTTVRTKGLMKASPHFWKFREIMTGTPATNKPTDLWSQIYILDQGKTFGKSFYAFRDQVMDEHANGPFPVYVAKPHVEEAIGLLIQPFTIRHEFDKCIDIPQNFIHVLKYELSKPLQKAYSTIMKDNAIAEIEFFIDNAAIKSAKLQQVCSGTSYINGIPHLFDTERYEATVELVVERGNRQGVIAFLWAHQRDYLMQQLDKKGITYDIIDGEHHNSDTVSNFQNGKVQILLLQPASAAHSITLTAGTYTIWASLPYNLEHFLQLNRRIYRAGQTKHTETIIQLAKGTIEETKIYPALLKKEKSQNKLLNTLT